MKHPADEFTRDAFDKPRRGRPRKPDALTPAERARRYRANKRAVKEFPLAGECADCAHFGHCASADDELRCGVGNPGFEPRQIEVVERQAPPGHHWSPGWPWPVADDLPPEFPVRAA